MKTGDKYTQARIRTTLAKAGVETFQGTTVTAYINHGRWVADCVCNGAELVAPGLPMVCGSCGAEHKVKFPGPKARADVEKALGVRDGRHQNWKGETVAELVAENIDNGIFPDDLKVG